MEQTTQQIETHIESTRDELGSNIYEFERKVKSVTDWRERFRKNPMLILSAAFSGGVLVASMISGRRNPKNESLYSRNAGDSNQKRSDRRRRRPVQGLCRGSSSRFSGTISKNRTGRKNGTHLASQQTEFHNMRKDISPLSFGQGRRHVHRL